MQRMQWHDIKKKFPNEWVALRNVSGDTATPYGEIEGEIILHSADENQFTAQLKAISSRIIKVDIRYTGDPLPDNPLGPILWRLSDTHS